jgi:hypothetical protein
MEYVVLAGLQDLSAPLAQFPVRERRAARKARAVMVALLAAVMKLVMAAQIVIAMSRGK